MTLNDPLFPAPSGAPCPASPEANRGQVIEKLLYDVSFTDELIRRCRIRAAQGYRLSSTVLSANKAEVVLVFETLEWNGVSFPVTGPDDRSC